MPLKRPHDLQPDEAMDGVSDGDRTHDHRNHNPALYRLSYAHHKEMNINARL